MRNAITINQSAGNSIVEIVERAICGVVGFFARCTTCGWIGPGHDREAQAVRDATKHICRKQ